MSGLEHVSDRTYRIVVYGIVFYFALLTYAFATNDPLGWTASYVVFGVIAIGVGGVLYSQTDGEIGALLGAAICLITGGVFQFVYLFTGNPAMDILTTVFIFVGIALYVYDVWVSE